MTRRRVLNQRLKALLGQYDKEIQEAFLRAVRSRSGSINIRELENAIEARDLNRVINIAGLTRADLFPVDQAIVGAYVSGGQTVAASAPAFAVAFGFDGRADRATRWAQSHVGGLVTSIVNDQLDMLRDTISRQVLEGVNPRNAALQIAGRVTPDGRQGGYIGLSNPQVQYLANARRELTELDARYFTRELRDRRFDPLVRKAIADGKPLAQADIDRVTGRYSDRMLKHRADTIARTESITALRAGRREGIEQGIEQGAIAQERVKRVWSATLDPRTRDDHASMNGQEVEGMDAPFTLPDGSQMLYPGDTSLGASAGQVINCRCFDEYVVDWLRA